MKFITSLTAMLIATLALLPALTQKLTALQLTPPGSGPAFEQVQITATQNLQLAIEQIFVAGDRTCLLYPLGDDHKTERAGLRDTIERTTEVMLLITARDYSATAGQMLGAPTADPEVIEPGILELKDQVVLALLGSSLGFSPQSVKVLPGAGGILQLEKQQDGGGEIEARQCWSQVLRIRAGHAVI